MLVSAAHGVMPSLSCHFIKDCVMNVVNNYAVTELITYFCQQHMYIYTDFIHKYGILFFL